MALNEVLFSGTALPRPLCPMTPGPGSWGHPYMGVRAREQTVRTCLQRTQIFPWPWADATFTLTLHLTCASLKERLCLRGALPLFKKGTCLVHSSLVCFHKALEILFWKIPVGWGLGVGGECLKRQTWASATGSETHLWSLQALKTPLQTTWDSWVSINPSLITTP